MHFSYYLDPIETTFSLPGCLFSSIRTHRIYSSLCDEASSLTQMSSCTHPRIAANSALIKRTSRCGKVIFSNSDKTECLKITSTYRPRCSVLPLKRLDFVAIRALAALLRLVSSHALAPSLALLIGGVLSDGALRHSFAPPRCSLQLSYRGRGAFFGFSSTPG